MFRPPRRSSSGASLVRTPPVVQLSRVEESPNDGEGSNNPHHAIGIPERGGSSSKPSASSSSSSSHGVLNTASDGGGGGGQQQQKKRNFFFFSSSSTHGGGRDDISASQASSSSSSTKPYIEHAINLSNLQAHLHILQPHHHLNLESIEKSYGLSTSDVHHRHHLYGPNELTPPPTTPDWIRFLEKFLDPFMLLLELAAILSFILYVIKPTNKANLYVALVLFFIITLTCFMAYHQEGQSVKLMSSFQNMMSDEAMVSR